MKFKNIDLNQMIALAFCALVIAKYVFKYKIDDVYIAALVAIMALIFAFNKPKPEPKVEMFSGSAVAFDKEAFENLNRIVYEIAGDGNLTIPGNLIVEGSVTIKNKNNTGDGLNDNAMIIEGENADEKVTINKEGNISTTGTLDVDGKLTANSNVEIIKTPNDDTTGKLTAHTVYTHIVDTDQLKGHAFKNSSVEKKRNSIYIRSSIATDNNSNINILSPIKFHENCILSEGKYFNYRGNARTKYGVGVAGQQATKDTSSCEIGYGIHKADTLCIVGGGPNKNSRSIYIWGSAELQNDFKCSNMVTSGTLDVNGQFNTHSVIRDHGGNAAFKNTATNTWTHITNPDGRMILDANNIQVHGRTNGFNVITGDIIAKNNITSNGILTSNGKFYCYGVSNFLMKQVGNNKAWSHLNFGDNLTAGRKAYIRGEIDFTGPSNGIITNNMRKITGLNEITTYRIRVTDRFMMGNGFEPAFRYEPNGNKMDFEGNRRDF